MAPAVGTWYRAECPALCGYAGVLAVPLCPARWGRGLNRGKELKRWERGHSDRKSFTQSQTSAFQALERGLRIASSNCCIVENGGCHQYVPTPSAPSSWQWGWTISFLQWGGCSCVASKDGRRSSREVDEIFSNFCYCWNVNFSCQRKRFWQPVSENEL